MKRTADLDDSLRKVYITLDPFALVEESAADHCASTMQWPPIEFTQQMLSLAGSSIPK